MRDRITRFFGSRLGIMTVGAIIGVIAPLLQYFGNPKNMGICVACFERDIVGALGFHHNAATQYLRPEIFGLVLGATIAALIFNEFRSRGGSSPLVRFILGMFAMIGALVFLGCPWRAILRLAGGDLNALVGIAGLAAGITAGVFFLKAGFSLGRAHRGPAISGWIMPVIMVFLLVLAVFRVSFVKDGALFFSESGPGSLAAPLAIALVAGLLIGFLAQRSRFCTMGALRDVILMRDTHLISGLGALLVVALVMNLILKQFNLGCAAQPVAHSNHLWNFLGMTLSGLAFALAGGCPGRQLFLAGEGDGDAGIFVLGMLSGAALAHNLDLAGKPDAIVDGVLKVGGISTWGMLAVLTGLVVCVAIGFGMRERSA
ncbi:MAG: YedE-related selenium metabolism membrane protein [Chloroflexi bacterium]|nr:YedE-related selenium metabolism membrane protein [Chloroflexota bacterium]